MVKNDEFEQGSIKVPPGNSIFTLSPKLFIKELATLHAYNSAKPVLEKEGKVIMAVSSFGKGTVFAIGDPWIYNEYVDGRKLPAEYQNYQGANEWVKWLAAQVKNSKSNIH